MNKEIQYLKNIQPGQQVGAYLLKNQGREYELLTVERLTPTQIVCEGGRRFKHNTNGSGQEIGGGSWLVSPHWVAMSRFETLASKAMHHMTAEQLAEETARLETLIATQEQQWP